MIPASPSKPIGCATGLIAKLHAFVYSPAASLWNASPSFFSVSDETKRSVYRDSQLAQYWEKPNLVTLKTK